MKSIILYGMGNQFSRIIDDIIDTYDILAISDKKITDKKDNNSYRNIPVVSPNKIREFDYDYIVICSDKYFESIRSYLIGNYYIDALTIVSPRLFSKGHYLSSSNILFFYQNRINDYQSINNYDYTGKYSFINIFIGQKKAHNGKNNLVLLWGQSGKDYLDKIDYTNSDIIWFISYDSLFKNDFRLYDKLKSYPYVKRYYFLEGICIELKKEKMADSDSTKIYVVSHKKYNVLHNQLYQPLFVGKNYQSEYAKMKGKHINHLNHILNECTALYWIWKNDKSEIIGINHYRRMFCNDNVVMYDNLLRKDKIYAILSEYDIILPKVTILEWSLYENIVSSVGEELARKGLSILKKLIKYYQPDYYEAFLSVMNSNCMYACNMFVAQRDLVNEYCKWLFSFIIEAANSLDVNSCSIHQQRTIGYFAETMITVWLYNKAAKIYTLPIILL